MPTASAITTWPKQPSPRGLPRVSLKQKQDRLRASIFLCKLHWRVFLMRLIWLPSAISVEEGVTATLMYWRLTAQTARCLSILKYVAWQCEISHRPPCFSYWHARQKRWWMSTCFSVFLTVFEETPIWGLRAAPALRRWRASARRSMIGGRSWPAACWSSWRSWNPRTPAWVQKETVIVSEYGAMMCV